MITPLTLDYTPTAKDFRLCRKCGTFCAPCPSRSSCLCSVCAGEIVIRARELIRTAHDLAV